jgi:hypothetical protein
MIARARVWLVNAVWLMVAPVAMIVRARGAARRMTAHTQAPALMIVLAQGRTVIVAWPAASVAMIVRARAAKMTTTVLAQGVTTMMIVRAPVEPEAAFWLIVAASVKMTVRARAAKRMTTVRALAAEVMTTVRARNPKLSSSEQRLTAACVRAGK